MIIRTGITTFLAASVIVGASLTPAFGQDDRRQFSTQSGEQVNQALELANANKFDDALAILRRALSDTDHTAYERSTLYQMMGQYSYELNRPVQAQRAFENAVSAGGLLPGEADNIKTVIAQLMIGNGQFRDGAEALEAHLSAGGEQKSQYVDLLVNAWVQAEDYERALPWAEIWFETADPKMRRHYDLMNFLYNNLGMDERQANIVKEMIDKWPKDKQLWGSWAAMLANGGREQDAFEVTKIMYLKGMLTTEKELLKVVQYYSFYDMPYQAAQILELEMDANRISRSPEQLKQLSGLYRQAREYKRAIPILEAAAGLSAEPATFAELGEAFYNEGECRKSELAFTEAISRGYDAGKSWILIATCHYDRTNELESLSCKMTDTEIAEAPITKARNAAVSAFKNVPGRSRERGNADKWIQFIEAENEAIERRCEINRHRSVELCYQKIKQAYDAAIFTRGFKLDDKSCEKYVSEYNAKYRNMQSED